ncbi:hypothetical protein I4131_12400 [Staphylococcus aureus]|nr:hypothetical protein [Staphylococcus aureus]MDU6091927.1 hypothetical protein [Staphylococcus lugdunensis]
MDRDLGCIFGFMLMVATLFAFSYFFVGIIINDEKSYNKDFSDYKKDTSIIQGNVIDSKKENQFLGPETYRLVIKTSKDQSQLVKVDEDLYRDYQKGSKVKFRIDKTDDNYALLDLKEDKDVQTKKQYNQYYEKHHNFLENLLHSE